MNQQQTEHNLSMKDIIWRLDRRQSRENPNRRRCKIEPEKHGGLGVHGSGILLQCGRCPYQEPASLPTEDGQNTRILVGQ